MHLWTCFHSSGISRPLYLAQCSAAVCQPPALHTLLTGDLSERPGLGWQGWAARSALEPLTEVADAQLCACSVIGTKRASRNLPELPQLWASEARNGSV